MESWEFVNGVAKKCFVNLVSNLSSLHPATERAEFLDARLLNGLKYGLLKAICSRATGVAEMHPYVQSEVSLTVAERI